MRCAPLLLDRPPRVGWRADQEYREKETRKMIINRRDKLEVAGLYLVKTNNAPARKNGNHSQAYLYQERTNELEYARSGQV